MNWLKRKLEIRRLRKLEREKLRAMMWAGYEASCGSPAGLREERQVEHEVNEIRAHIEELRIQAEHDKVVAAMNKAAGNWAKADAGLRRACQFIAGYGSCPYDTFNLYEPWEESCYQKCSADIDRAECWRRYFERGGDA